jgi:hypothetical protein
MQRLASGSCSREEPELAGGEDHRGLHREHHRGNHHQARNRAGRGLADDRGEPDGRQSRDQARVVAIEPGGQVGRCDCWQGLARRAPPCLVPRSEVVPPAADRVAECPEQRQDRADHYGDDADCPDDRDFRDEPDDEKNHAENDQGKLLTASSADDGRRYFRAGGPGRGASVRGLAFYTPARTRGITMEDWSALAGGHAGMLFGPALDYLCLVLGLLTQAHNRLPCPARRGDPRRPSRRAAGPDERPETPSPCEYQLPPRIHLKHFWIPFRQFFPSFLVRGQRKKLRTLLAPAISSATAGSGVLPGVICLAEGGCR